MRVALAVLLYGSGGARGTVPREPDGGQRSLRCAVLVADGGGAGAAVAPLAELLQAELAGRADLALVERDEIDRVLREQQLSEAFAAAQTARRAALGRLLRADLLVLLRAGEAPPAAGPPDGGGAAGPPAVRERRENRLHAWVAVCETRQGLRLSTSAIPLTPDVRGNAAAAAGHVDAAVAKLRERVLTVVAVPPFLSRDLARDADHFKATCAKVVEQALLQRDGVLVVELGEAAALAKEVALAADGADVRRTAAPLYLLGEYRTGRSRARDRKTHVTARLSLRRGDRELATADTDAVPTGDLPAALAKAVDGLGAHFAAGPGDAAAAEAAEAAPGTPPEARALAARAREFYVLGDWAEAAALYEAALLLDPSRPEARLELALSLVRTPLTSDERDAMAAEALRRADAFPEDRARETAIIERLIAGLERRLGHLEIYLRDGEHADLSTTMWEFGWPPFEIGGTDTRHAAVAGFNARIKTAQREFRLRVIRARALSGAPGDVVVGALLSGVPWRVGGETQEDALRLMMTLFREIAHLPEAPRYATTLVSTSSRPLAADGAKPGTPEHDAFVAARKTILLDPLRAWPDERVGAAVTRYERESREMTARIQREQDAAITALKPAPGAGAPERVVFRPFDPKLVTPDGKALSLNPGDFLRWKPAGVGVDVVWAHAGVWIVREPGRAEPAFAPVDGGGPPSSVSYDGRYLWIALHGAHEGQPPVLLARDLRPDGRTWRVTAEHGLPLPEPRLPSFDPAERVPPHVLTVVGVRPGQACVAGHFGRTWFATVTLDADAGPTAEVFHEAREVTPQTSLDEGWSNPSVAFKPEAMFVIRGDKGTGGAPPAVPPSRVVVTGRGDRPLVLDPDGRTASAMRTSLFPLQSGEAAAAFAEHGGALYVITMPSYKRVGDYTGQPRGPYLYRIAFPDLEPVPVLMGVPQGHLRFDRGRILVVGRGVWLLELDAKRSWPQATRVPWLHRNAFWHPDDPAASVFPNPIPPDVLLLSNVFTSNHYGLLATASDRMGIYTTFRAEFTDGPRP